MESRTRLVDDSTDLASIWMTAIGRFDETVRPNQRAWLSQTRPLGLVEDTVVIAAPNEWVKDYLETRLRPLIASALSEELGRDIQVAVTVQRTEDTPDNKGPDDAGSTGGGQTALASDNSND